MKKRIARFAAIGAIALVAATGCSSTKHSHTPGSAVGSSTPPATVQNVDLTPLDAALSQIDTQVSGANAGLKSTSEGDVQTR